MQRLFLWFSLTLTCSSQALAYDDDWEIERFFSGTSKAIMRAIAEGQQTNATPPAWSERAWDINNWQFYSFQIRVRPRIGFNLPQLVSLDLVPSLEFAWVKREHLTPDTLARVRY